MRVLGIDYGDRHLGLALSDPLLVTARPLGSYTLTGNEAADRRYFRELVYRHEVEEIVIGFPLRMDGSEGSRVEKTKQFAAWLEKAVGKRIVFMDERLTTRQAQGMMREEKKGPVRLKKEREDELSAVIILSTYLERKRSERDADEDT